MKIEQEQPEAIDPARIAGILGKVRARRPLVHAITNEVAMALTANVLLAVGASPAMVVGAEEVAEFVVRADALLVNIGTLTAPRAHAMRLAVAAAATRPVPWALDPVGAGSTTHRRNFALELAGARPTVIRGNANEIAILAGTPAAEMRGVDASIASADALEAAVALARASGAVVAVTGAIDYITDGARVIRLANGAPMMARVTALGCSASALVAAALAVEADPLHATVAALAWIAIAGEIAATDATGPGTLQPRLLDALFTLDAPTLVARARLS